jgi:mutator protein MutT
VTSKAAVMIIRNADNQILSIPRKNDPGKYGLPGGKCEEDETPQKAAIRETFEETGVQVNSCRLVFVRVEDSISGKFETYCFQAIDWGNQPYNKEGTIPTWLTKEQLISKEFGAFPEYNKLSFEHLQILEEHDNK